MSEQLINGILTTLASAITSTTQATGVQVSAVPAGTISGTVRCIFPASTEVLTFTGYTGAGPYTLTGVVREVEGTASTYAVGTSIGLGAITAGSLTKLTASIPQDIRFYGAKCDGKQVLDAAMTSASAALTSASAAFSATDVGKSIIVTAAGAAGVDLVTTISAYVSATQVTLAVNAGSTVTGKQAVYGSDDTAVIQSCIDAVYNAGGGVVNFPAGISFVTGTLQTSQSAGDTATYNAQIRLPYRLPSKANVNIKLVGPTGTGPYLQFAGQPSPSSGFILVSTGSASGTTPSVIGGPRESSGTFNFSSMTLALERFTVRLPNNPQLTAIDTEFIGAVEIIDVCADNNSGVYQSIQPTNTASVGLILPHANNNALVYLRNVYVSGFYCGIRSYEHTVFDTVTIQSCWHGVELGGGYHACTATRLMILQCPYGLYSIGGDTNSGSHYLSGTLDLEFNTYNGPTWMNQVYTLYDPNCLINGQVVVHAVQAGVGVVESGITKYYGMSFDFLPIIPNPLPIPFLHGNDAVLAGNAFTHDSSGSQSGDQWYQNPSAQNDAFRTPNFALATQQLVRINAFGVTSGGSGIVTLSVRNAYSNAAVATFNGLDFYTAAANYNTSMSTQALMLPAGPYYIRGDMSSKNASSVAYNLGLTQLTLTSP